MNRSMSKVHVVGFENGIEKVEFDDEIGIESGGKSGVKRFVMRSGGVSNQKVTKPQRNLGNKRDVKVRAETTRRIDFPLASASSDIKPTIYFRATEQKHFPRGAQ